MYCLCRSTKTISARIYLLDDTEFLHDIQDDLSGQALLDIVFARLNLIETAYFGVRYIDDENQTHWLDPTVRISRQLKGPKEIFDLYFGVKFYAADPCKLVEEITRYQLYLQVKQDVLQGRLPVTFELAAELGAYVIQSELGDYDSRKHPPGYVSEFNFLSNQTRDLELRVAELHQQLMGMVPSQAELNYLDKVKWHDMYGIDLHPVLGEDSVEYYLGLTPSGIVVLRNKTTVAHYYWPRIAKVYFKGRYFMLRVCDKNNEVSTYGFETPRKSACKHLWKCCVEHHAFFRLVRVAPLQPQTGTSELFALGSRFRYSGRTEKQALKDAMAHNRTPPQFTRTPSRRQTRRIHIESEDKTVESTKYVKDEIKTISIPQPAQNFENPYRSSGSIPATLNTRSNSRYSNTVGQAPDSPRSTRSAPWMRSQQRGLFGITSSPKSVRSASTRVSAPVHTNRYRSSSVESQSSNDSRSGRRHRHKSKRQSDNESEFSRGSGRSGRSHNSHRKHRRHRSKSRRTDSGSENEGSRYRMSGGSAELIDSGKQWQEVQRRQAETMVTSSVQEASVMKSSMAAKHHNSEMDMNGGGHHKSRKHRKHRSPTDSRAKIWSSELTRHLQFGLVDTTGMSEDQLREIPYTVVETHNTGRRVNASSLSKVNKPNYAKDRVDHIRDVYTNEKPGSDITPVVNGSIRSASTISSSRDYDRNSGLMRMMSSLSMGDFISPTNSNLTPLDNSGIRVSHEHTDSGLGADQDYAYSSERSSDSAKYGTNKSSGTSVTSNGNKPQQSHQHHPLNLNKNNIHSNINSVQQSVSNRKPPLCPNRQQIAVHNSSTSSSSATYNHSNSNNRLYNSNNINNSNTNINNNNYTVNHYNSSRLMRDNGGVGGYSSQNHLDHSYSSSALTSMYGYCVGGDANDSYASARSTVQKQRTAKSDVGIPISRGTYSSSLQHKIFPKSSSKNPLSPSDHNLPYTFGMTSSAAAAHSPNARTSHNNNNNNNNNYTATLPYHISGGGAQTADYLENYKTGFKHFYNSNSNLINNNNHNNNNNITSSLSHLDVNKSLQRKQSQPPNNKQAQQQQQQQTQQQYQQNANDGYNDNGGNKSNINNSSNGGPLLYLDTDLNKNQRNMLTGVKSYRNQNNPSIIDESVFGQMKSDDVRKPLEQIHRNSSLTSSSSSSSSASSTTTTASSATAAATAAAAAITATDQKIAKRSSSLELILTPIIQSRRAQ